MLEDLFSHELLLLGLLWLSVILYGVGRRRQAVADQAHGSPAKRATRSSQAPKPFPGLTTTPRCGACEPGPGESPPATPPAQLHSPYGRPRTVAPHHQFCPEPTCRYYGWVGRGNLRANGHPGGGPWQQLSCVACGGYFLETHGTPLHGKRVPTELIARVMASLAEGLGIRATARVFQVDPNTVLAWLIEAADHLEAFSQARLHDVQINQVQLDE
jgi:transposase-like protein